MLDPAGRGRRWVLAAAAVGFGSSYILSAVLRLPQAWFVTGHAVVTAGLFVLYARWQGMSARTQLSRRWGVGLIIGVAFGVVLVRQVMGQTPSARPVGAELVGQLAVFGLIYGVVDALLLSILPVLALYGSRPVAELRSPGTRLGWALMALLGSVLVTALYHAGFEEFRGPQLIQPIIGNTVITLAYLLTGSPLAPMVAHVMMHGAAVLHGASTTIQLPPHYS